MKKNLNQNDLAKIINATQAQVNEWLSSKSKPNYNNLQMIAKTFKIDGYKILDLEQKRKIN